MNIKHEIISFDSVTGAILVHYFTDEIQQGYAYNIDLPIVNGMLPTEIEIEEIINLHSPRVQLERIEAMKTATVPEYLANLIPSTSEVTSTQ